MRNTRKPRFDTSGKGGGGGLCVPRQSVVVPIVGFDSDLVAGKVHVYQWD